MSSKFERAKKFINTHNPGLKHIDKEREYLIAFAEQENETLRKQLAEAQEASAALLRSYQRQLAALNEARRHARKYYRRSKNQEASIYTYQVDEMVLRPALEKAKEFNAGWLRRSRRYRQQDAVLHKAELKEAQTRIGELEGQLEKMLVDHTEIMNDTGKEIDSLHDELK